MKRWLVLLAACGSGSSAPQQPSYESAPPQPVTVEWKVEQGEGDNVDVTLVVDGRANAIGALHAVTDFQRGQDTCALRAASPRRTEIVCGDANAYRAELGEREIIVSLVAGAAATEVKRIPAQGDVLAVKMLVLPGSNL